MRVRPRRSRVSSAVLFGVLAFPAAAWAAPTDADSAPAAQEPPEYRFEFGLDGGAHFFNKKSGLGRNVNDPEGLSPKTTVAFGGHLALNFNRWVSIEAQAVMMPTHSRFSDADGGTRLTVFGYRGNLVVHLIPTGVFRPFVFVGYGGMSSISNDTNRISSDDDSDLFVGLGAKIALGDHAGLRVDGRIMVPPAVFGKSVPVGHEPGYEGPDFEALGSFFVNFGEVERVNRTVVKKEVIVQAPPANPDPDGDGIAGAADKCPDVAEDKDGFEDEDGCPDPDNDKDGIPDAQDKCPNEPETDNGINDDDGCPDEVPQAVKKFTGVIEGINFKTGSDKIRPGSYAILDRAVAVLKDYPDIRIEISGHTDSKGKADYNRDLSQRRADAVKVYFIGKGIDTSRLATVGYGMDKPLADNATESGRSKNRRTEFRLLMGDEGTPGSAGSTGSGPAPANKVDSGPPPCTP